MDLVVAVGLRFVVDVIVSHRLASSRLNNENIMGSKSESTENGYRLSLRRVYPTQTENPQRRSVRPRRQRLAILAQQGHAAS